MFLYLSFGVCSFLSASSFFADKQSHASNQSHQLHTFGYSNSNISIQSNMNRLATAPMTYQYYYPTMGANTVKPKRQQASHSGPISWTSTVLKLTTSPVLPLSTGTSSPAGSKGLLIRSILALEPSNYLVPGCLGTPLVPAVTWKIQLILISHGQLPLQLPISSLS